MPYTSSHRRHARTYAHPADRTPYGVLTGDALFIGDVGRPDLLSASGLAPADMAAQLYRSLWGKLLTLPEGTRAFPAHGAGSARGKNLSTRNSSTIGEERRTNYALAFTTEEQFVVAVTEGQPVTPPYFAFDARRNLQALCVPRTVPRPLNSAFAAGRSRGHRDRPRSMISRCGLRVPDARPRAELAGAIRPIRHNPDPPQQERRDLRPAAADPASRAAARPRPVAPRHVGGLPIVRGYTWRRTPDTRRSFAVGKRA
jgi:hypothetical protein